MAPCKKAGCGFFGNDATDGYCSRCFLAQLSTSSSSGSVSPRLTEKAQANDLEKHEPLPGDESGVSASVDSPAEASAAASGQKREVVRCNVCAKRLSLGQQLKCRCGNFFCTQHKHFERHLCTFDYKSAGRVAIEKTNPALSRRKLDEI